MYKTWKYCINIIIAQTMIVCMKRALKWIESEINVSYISYICVGLLLFKQRNIDCDRNWVSDNKADIDSDMSWGQTLQTLNSLFALNSDSYCISIVISFFHWLLFLYVSHSFTLSLYMCFIYKYFTHQSLH